MVFDDDPLVNPGAEIMYPLYVWDRSIRDNARCQRTGLGGLYNEALIRLDRSAIGEDIRYVTFSDDSARGLFGTGVFIYGADCREAKVLSVYRLKYLPHTKDTGKGVDVEKERSAKVEGKF